MSKNKNKLLVFHTNVRKCFKCRHWETEIFVSISRTHHLLISIVIWSYTNVRCLIQSVYIYLPQFVLYLQSYKIQWSNDFIFLGICTCEYCIQIVPIDCKISHYYVTIDFLNSISVEHYIRTAIDLIFLKINFPKWNHWIMIINAWYIFIYMCNCVYVIICILTVKLRAYFTSKEVKM